MDFRGVPRRRRQADVEPRTARHGLSQALCPSPPSCSGRRRDGRLQKLLPRLEAIGREEGVEPSAMENLVGRRGARRPRGRGSPGAGLARRPSKRSQRSAEPPGLILQRDPSEGRQRRGARSRIPHAERRTPSRRNRHPKGTRRAAGRSGRLALFRQFDRPTRTSLSIPFPAKCPKLNPQENIWQFLRDNWLSNRIFNSFDDIVDHCCDAWNKLINQPWRIMSIGLRTGPIGHDHQLLSISRPSWW